MLEEIKRHVVHLRTGDRVQPGVRSKFAEFHRWALDQARAELRWEPRPGFRQIVGADGKLEDTDEPLPPTPIRSERYLAWEALLVALATIPRLPAVDRRSRADEILEAVGSLEALVAKPMQDPTLPIVDLENDTITFRGKTHAVCHDIAVAYDILVESHPRPVAMQRELDSQLGDGMARWDNLRKSKSLPRELKAITASERGKGTWLQVD